MGRREDSARAGHIQQSEDRGFPIGEERAGVLFVDTEGLLDAVYRKHPEARTDVVAFLLAGKVLDQ